MPPSLSDSQDAGDSPIVQPGGTLPLLPDISYEEERDEIRGDPVDVGCHSFVAMAYTTSFVSARTPRGAIPYNSSFCPNDPANTMGRARILLSANVFHCAISELPKERRHRHTRLLHLGRTPVGGYRTRPISSMLARVVPPTATVHRMGTTPKMPRGPMGGDGVHVVSLRTTCLKGFPLI